MLNFDKVYSECEKVWLDVNYRSGAAIVQASYRLIEHNTRRFQKIVKEATQDAGEIKVLEWLP